MPVEKYFKGHGDEVMSKMKKKYGEKKGEAVFYATAKKRGFEPSSAGKRRHPKKWGS